MRLAMAADFARLDEAFQRVAAAPPAERDAMLRESCSDDPDLRREVERLLAIDASLPAFVQDGHIDSALGRRAAAALLDGERERTPLPARIGPYEITGFLGAGGMGTVYRARQAHPRRDVALKVMRYGAMSPKMIGRFEFEADILARLQHPGIAQVYEAGTWDDGSGARPYFAMELVEGATLADFADQHHLDDRQRLALFVQLCRAVEHAHQKGVVHRDLKPDNILITADGGLKVLDFGIARAMDSDVQAATMFTAPGDLVGTLGYMSPEQVAGNAHDIDTRTDVYALGVILYELLSGALPHDLRGKSIPNSATIIAHEAAPPLRTRHQRFAGDLDTIAAMAMEKDRERRYASAGALADDIERHLRDEPIAARPPGTFEQWRRLVRRHKALAASVLLAAMSLAAATGFSTWMAWRESRAHALAQANATAASKQADRAERVKNLMVGMFTPMQPGRPKSMVTVQDMLAQATQRVQSELADQPDIASEMRGVLARIYHNLDLSQHAVPLLEELLAAEKASGAESLPTLNLLADAYNRDCNYARASACEREIVEIHRRMGPATSVEAIDALNGLAHTLTFGGDPQQALRLRQEALSLLDSIEEPRPRQRYAANLGIGTALMIQGRFAEAEVKFREIMRDDQFSSIFWPRYYLASVLLKQGKIDSAMEVLVPLLESARSQAEGEPRRLGLACNLYSLALQSRMELAQAEEAARQAVAIFEKIDAAKLTTALRQLASVFHNQGKHDEALETLNRAQEVMRPAWRGSADEAATLDLKARVLASMGRVAAADDAADAALAIKRTLKVLDAETFHLARP